MTPELRRAVIDKYLEQQADLSGRERNAIDEWIESGGYLRLRGGCYASEMPKRGGAFVFAPEQN